MTRDYRDLVIEDLTLAEAVLQARVRELEADVRLRREMVSVLLERCYLLTHTVEGLRRVLQIADDDAPGVAA
ncbi:MAG: hypothetical protein KBA95_01740 [Acidobacteria bacterium]|nr:hypothetical protein [Acidobacteriota bacterium]